jgi:1-carboxybiuret hydrolase
MNVTSSFEEVAVSIAADVRSGRRSARETTAGALERIANLDGTLNCFTRVMRESALAQADAVDQQVLGGRDPGPLAGVPFAVKNLFDIAGVTTLAGSKIQAQNPVAERDATVVAKLKQAGAVLVGALNMDEYAYGFTTENTHYGVTRNPHDLDCVAGGSSGGSAAAVAAGLVPLTLGSDTNGSIRVPAAFCGVFGFKPTYGRVSRAGSFLFVESFDHAGPFARSVADIALAFDALQGPDPRDPVSSARPVSACTPDLPRGAEDLRIAVADGYFQKLGLPETYDAVLQVAQALGVQDRVSLPDVEAARAAAYIITACEGANRHLPDLRTRPDDFDPLIVERLLAGALLPAAWYVQAQRFRSLYQRKILKLFEHVDVILAPATPCPAIRANQPTITVNGQQVLSRPNIGVFTQPLSFVGLPILSVPIFKSGHLPLGVQIIAAPYNESAVLRVAAQLEAMGVCFVQAPEILSAKEAG